MKQIAEVRIRIKFSDMLVKSLRKDNMDLETFLKKIVDVYEAEINNSPMLMPLKAVDRKLCAVVEYEVLT